MLSRNPAQTTVPPRADWLAIGELAQRAGVTPDCLRAWERRYGLLKPRRSPGNRRLYSAADEARVRLMQRYIAEGKPAGVAAEMVSGLRLGVRIGERSTVAATDVRAAHDELRASLDRYEETAAQRILERLFVAYSRVAVLRDVVLPYLEDVGERWARDHLTVAQEHFASGFFETRLMAMARGWDRGVGPRALIACPRGERHVFGLVAFGIALHELGWRITYLGADTPIEMLDGAAEQVQPDLIVLSAVLSLRFAHDDESLRALAGRWPCALGGAGADVTICDALGARPLTQDPISAAADIADL